MERRAATHHVVLPSGARIPVAALVTPSGTLYRAAGLVTSHIRQSPIPWREDAPGEVLEWSPSGYRIRPDLRVETID